MLVRAKRANEHYPAPEVGSEYLLLAPRILRDACRAARRDDDGRGCAACCVRNFCEDQARRAGDLAAAD